MAFLRPAVYIRFSAERLWLRRFDTGECLDDSPETECEASTSLVLRIGREAARLTALPTVAGNGFVSERTIVGDVDLAEIALRYALERLLPPRGRKQLPFGFAPKPDLILHPQIDARTQLTKLELQGLTDLGRRCGGRRVQIWIGRELTDAEVHAGAFHPAWKSWY